MPVTRRATFLLALAALPLGAQQQSTLPVPPRAVVAFTDVTVLPMDRERRLTGQTVVVRDGRIAEVGPAARVKVPSGATVVDARGKFLMPGLAEMHAHVPPVQQGEPPAQVIDDIMMLYLANGVTTIRGMLGSPYQLALRERLRNGQQLGPRFFVSAPSLNGNSAPNPDTAAKLVRAYKQQGYDFLKIHPGLTRASYDAIVRTAREVGLTLGGHVPDDVGVRHALASRQGSIDHLDGYLEDAAGVTKNSLAMQGPEFTSFAAAIDTTKLAALARDTKAAGTWVVPTAFLWETFFSTQTADELLASLPEVKYVSPQQRASWANQKRQRTAMMTQQAVPADASARYIALRRRMLRHLVDAGAPLLMGTDSPQVFNVPGFALHRELEVARGAGLTPWQVLESGTRNVARYASEVLKLDGRFGTVAVGQRADLVLLDADPLLDLANLQRRAGVMVDGRWLPWSELQSRLDAIEARHKATASR